MARVPKYKVDQMVEFLLKDAKEQHKKALSDIKETVIKVYLKNIPKEIVDMYEKHPNYFNKTHYVYYSGAGLTYSSVSLKVDEKLPSSQNGVAVVIEDSKTLKKLSDLQKFVKETNDDISSLTNTLTKTISTLSTEKKILTEFPELSDFFIKEGTTVSLALPIADLKTQLEKYKTNNG